MLNPGWQMDVFPLQACLSCILHQHRIPVGTRGDPAPEGDRECPSSFSAVISCAWKIGQGFPESINYFVLLEELAVLQRKILIPLSLLLQPVATFPSVSLIVDIEILFYQFPWLFKIIPASFCSQEQCCQQNKVFQLHSTFHLSAPKQIRRRGSFLLKYCIPFGAPRAGKTSPGWSVFDTGPPGWSVQRVPALLRHRIGLVQGGEELPLGTPDGFQCQQKAYQRDRRLSKAHWIEP